MIMKIHENYPMSNAVSENTASGDGGVKMEKVDHIIATTTK